MSTTIIARHAAATLATIAATASLGSPATASARTHCGSEDADLSRQDERMRGDWWAIHHGCGQ